MKNVRLIIKKVIDRLSVIIWPSYIISGNELPSVVVFKYWVIQKVIRINSHVPWPVHPTSTIKEPLQISRGSRTPGLSPYCYIDGRNGIRIGKNVWIGPKVSIISMNHDTSDYNQYIQEASIVIGDNSWLGTGCIILPGVNLGKHTVVAAGAVVTKSFTEGDVVLGGVPAKIIKTLGDYQG